MSQYGAKGMAEQGVNYQQIVLHFFRGTRLAKIDPR
jgi:SpoIID/LytB domain protein